ncbi:MAG TPA: thioredoxin domain-containing protein [Hyphomicrobiaceae bacterium]|nr:thioredoxin domain-containing protein [Hyphomicrobiaceae bacterium]
MSENRLARETSPYLLQHKDNPVHWWAWGPEALAEAKDTGKPILLSIGYAACHWCHVMAHESFEDEAIAALMNDLFVNIKVDREERPDIDAIYMRALHTLGEQGGWPLTMFLDSEARPFWGGTYFPPTPRYGRPAFPQVLKEVARVFTEERDKVSHNAGMLVEALNAKEERKATALIEDAVLADLTGRMVSAVDAVNGGLSGAPKFPQWSFFWLLWRGAVRYGNAAARQAVETTLTHICQGGIYDHLGGGFARYSVDERWLVPHFEKMLYDNALLVDLLCEAHRETGAELYARRIEETVGWLLREMVADGGGFAASLDADSEGEEGKFYVWTKAEIVEVLGEADAQVFCEAYDVTDAGNWEGHTILNRLRTPLLGAPTQEKALAHMRLELLARRAQRVRPGWDDKVLADWNGLMIAGLVHAARVFDRPEWLAAAARAFSFIVETMEKDGRLAHSWRAGRLKAAGTASDYANMIWAALRLLQATNEPAFLTAAERWCATLDKHFWMTEEGGYAFTADDTPDVIVRMRGAHDDATPNANAIMLSNLVALGLLTGNPAYLERAEAIPQAFAADLGKNTLGHCGLLAGFYDLIAPQQVVVIGTADADASAKLSRAMFKLSLPGAVQQLVAASSLGPSGVATAGALLGKTALDGKPTAYACIGPQCSLPVTEGDALLEVLRGQRARPAAS